MNLSKVYHKLYPLKKISERTFILKPCSITNRPLLGILSGTDYSLMVDAGNSANHFLTFISKVKREEIMPIKYVVLTHSHWDHISGIDSVQCKIIAHKKTAEKIKELMSYKWDNKSIYERVKNGKEISFCATRMIREINEKERINYRLKMPDITFDNDLRIDLGNRICRISHIGGVHSEDSSIIIDEKYKIVFLGDCLFYNLYDEKANMNYVENLYKLINNLLEYDADLYLPSHGKAMNQTMLKKYPNYFKNYKNV